MNRYEKLKESYEVLNETYEKYKGNIMINEINKKIQNGEIKTLRQLFKALDLPWIECDRFGRGMKDKQLPNNFKIEMFED